MQARASINSEALRRNRGGKTGLRSFIRCPPTAYNDDITRLNFYSSASRSCNQLSRSHWFAKIDVSVCSSSRYIKEHTTSDNPIKPHIQCAPLGSTETDAVVKAP